MLGATVCSNLRQDPACGGNSPNRDAVVSWLTLIQLSAEGGRLIVAARVAFRVFEVDDAALYAITWVTGGLVFIRCPGGSVAR